MKLSRSRGGGGNAPKRPRLPHERRGGIRERPHRQTIVGGVGSSPWSTPTKHLLFRRRLPASTCARSFQDRGQRPRVLCATSQHEGGAVGKRSASGALLPPLALEHPLPLVRRYRLRASRVVSGLDACFPACLSYFSPAKQATGIKPRVLKMKAAPRATSLAALVCEAVEHELSVAVEAVSQQLTVARRKLPRAGRAAWAARSIPAVVVVAPIPVATDTLYGNGLGTASALQKVIRLW